MIILYNLFLFILINFAASYIITNSYAFEWLRIYLDKKSPKLFGKWIHCILCVAVWSGFLLSFIYSPSFLIFTNIRILSIFFDGLFGGITSYGLCLLYCKLKP